MTSKCKSTQSSIAKEPSTQSVANVAPTKTSIAIPSLERTARQEGIQNQAIERRAVEAARICGARLLNGFC